VGRTDQHANRDVLVDGDPAAGTSAQVTGPEGGAMTRAGTGSPAPPGAVSAPAGRADTCIRAAAGVTVAGLAGIAGAISYMQELAASHGEIGWQAHAFALSVNGIEIVAPLARMLEHRRAEERRQRMGRPARRF
jgi:hypothetical protein